MGIVRARTRRRHALQVRDPQPRQRCGADQNRSLRAELRAAPCNRRAGEHAAAAYLERRRVAGAARAAGLAACAARDLRNPCRLVAPPSRWALLHLSRTRAALGPIRARHGLHAYRTDAGHRTSARRIMGVPDLSLIHISEPTRLGMISYAVFCLKKK